MYEDARWGEIYKEREMLLWYDNLRAFYLEKRALCKNDDDVTFLEGYTLHILVDIMNCKLLYGPNLVRYNFVIEDMRHNYRRDCIRQDIYLLQQNYEGNELFAGLQRTADIQRIDSILKNLGLEYISAENVADNVISQRQQLLDKETENLEGTEMLSLQSTGKFLDEVADVTKRLLYEFPNPGTTFKTDYE